MFWRKFNEPYDDLFCDEEIIDSEDEPQSQATPPKKKKKFDGTFPEILNPFVSNAMFSNRTMSCFVVHTTREKSEHLYQRLMKKFQTTFISRHSYRETGILYFLTPTKHRVSAINNYCKTQCTYSFFHCKGVNDIYQCYSCLTRDPFAVLEESIPGGLKEHDFTREDVEGDPTTPQVNWVLLSELACDLKTEDVYLLMGLYWEFSVNPELCEKCRERKIEDHYKNHPKHHTNASLFIGSKNQKNACQQAVDVYVAKRRVEIAHKTRAQLLLARFEYLFKKMDQVLLSESDFHTYMAGVAWYSVLFPKFDDLLMKYLEMVVDNVPKSRYWLLKGPINSGKTTFAAALLDLCGGRALNINCPADRLSFELGCAIDQFTIVFEDVKGQSEQKDLQYGNGVNNLDNLRDHLDGAVPVNLEKKHMNKKAQVFPPGLVTMNNYFMPPTLMARFAKVLTFMVKPCLSKSLELTPEVMGGRILQSGMTLLLLLLWFRPTSDFMPEIQEKVVYYKELIDSHVSVFDFACWKDNITKGIYIFEKPFNDSGFEAFVSGQSTSTQGSQ